MLQKFPGYDPQSPTLLGPRRCSGTCLGDEFPNGRTLVWIDPEAQLFSGDLVLVLIGENGQPSHAVGAYLRNTRRGQWFAENGTGVMPLSILPILSIAKIVAREILPTQEWNEPEEDMTHSERALMLKWSRAARDEWARLGHPARTPFPGIVGRIVA